MIVTLLMGIILILIGLQSISTSIYLLNFLTCRMKSNLFFVVNFLLFLLTKVNITVGNVLYESKYLLFLVILLEILLLFKGKFAKKIFHYLYISFIILLQNDILSMYIDKYGELNNETSFSFLFLFLLIIVVTVIIVTSLNYFKAENQLELVGNDYILLSITPFASIILLLFPFETSLISRVVFSTMILTINLSIIFIYNKFSERKYDYLKEFSTGIESQRYKEHSEEYEEIQLIKHDLKNLLISVDYLLSEEKIDLAREKLEEILSFSNHFYERLTGCWVIDSLLNLKVNQMKQEHIHYKMELQIPSDIKIDDITLPLFSILGNILDNAIEEYKNLDVDGLIEIYLKYHEEKLIIKVVNTSREKKMDFTKKIIQSEKKRGRLGLGINSIKEHCEKLKGYHNFSYLEGKFSVLVIIPVTNS